MSTILAVTGSLLFLATTIAFLLERSKRVGVFEDFVAACEANDRLRLMLAQWRKVQLPGTALGRSAAEEAVAALVASACVLERSTIAGRRHNPVDVQAYDHARAMVLRMILGSGGSCSGGRDGHGS